MERFEMHLWFDKEAAEATEFYLSLFEDSKELGRSIFICIRLGN